MATILVRGGVMGYNSEKGTTQGPLNQSLVQTGHAFSEEKIFKHFYHRCPMLKLCLRLMSTVLGWLDVVIGYKSEREPPKEHSN